MNPNEPGLRVNHRGPAPKRRSARTAGSTGPTEGARIDTDPARDNDDGSRPSGGILRTAGAAILAIGLLASIAQLPGDGAGAETGHPNWKHVDAASQAGGGTVQHVTLGGAALATAITLGEEDRDVATTESIREAFVAQAPEEAERVLREAQQISPPAIDDEAVLEEIQELQREPSLSPGLQDAVVTGDVEFFHIHLYDSCVEDGDVVEVVINGASFAVVPITHAGSTLSVPIPTTGASTIAIRGIRDGGGGITVACRTSQGDFFSRVMGVGEIQPLSLLRN